MRIEQLIDNIVKEHREPVMGLNALEMGLNLNYEVTADTISITSVSGFPQQRLIERFFKPLCENIQKQCPSKEIIFNYETLVRSHQTQLAGKALRHVKNCIAIASGKGGVGKSTLAVHLAASLARQGAKVGILDADIYGPSIPLMLGEHQEVEIEGEFYRPVRVHGLQAMSIGWLTDKEQALIWRGPMLAKALLQMMNITLWDDLDYLFIDLPPGTGDIQLSLVQKIPLAGSVIISTPQQIATSDAQKAISMFHKTNIPVLGLIENMSLHHCSQCGHEEAIFGSGGAEKLAHQMQVPLLGQVPLNQHIMQAADSGRPLSAHENKPQLSEIFDQLALKTVMALAKRPINYAGKFPDIVVE